MEITHLATDVLIVGGGLAGTNAAMGAAENGASVVVADKGNINRSGDIGGNFGWKRRHEIPAGKTDLHLDGLRRLDERHDGIRRCMRRLRWARAVRGS